MQAVRERYTNLMLFGDSMPICLNHCILPEVMVQWKLQNQPRATKNPKVTRGHVRQPPTVC